MPSETHRIRLTARDAARMSSERGPYGTGPRHAVVGQQSESAGCWNIPRSTNECGVPPTSTRTTYGHVSRRKAVPCGQHPPGSNENH